MIGVQDISGLSHVNHFHPEKTLHEKSQVIVDES
jgi:hypothetical protein